MELAFERLNLGVVTASHADDNERSRRAIEKYIDEYGGQHDGINRSAPKEGEIETYHQYSVTKTEYRASTD